jgi:ABC-2 type transport system permease protein
MRGALPVIERELRRFRRSPVLIVISMVFPIVQLVILGYAFEGTVRHLKVGGVDQDQRVPAVRLRELFGAVAVNAETFETINYNDPGMALADLRNWAAQRRPGDPAGFLAEGFVGDGTAHRFDRGQYG